MLTYTDHLQCSCTLLTYIAPGAAVHWSVPMQDTLVSAATRLGVVLKFPTFLEALCERTMMSSCAQCGLFPDTNDKNFECDYEIVSCQQERGTTFEASHDDRIASLLSWLRYIVVKRLSHIIDSYHEIPQVRRPGGQHHLLVCVCT